MIDLLEVTRLETGTPTFESSRTSVSDAVRDAVDRFEVAARRGDVTLWSDLPPDLPAAYADETGLLQILIILLDNAVKFTPAGGAIRVHARLLPDQGCLQIAVSDTGCGIESRICDELFDRADQVSEPTRAGRRVLGSLDLCRELVARQGGQIRVKSQPDVGSTFSFTLPVFSLQRLLAPLVRDGRWPAGSAALITVELYAVRTLPASEVRAGLVRKARGIVRRCLLPDLDLLLPAGWSDDERLSIAVFADAQGTSILGKRIRAQLERHLADDPGAAGLSVSYTMLPPFPRVVGASTDEAAVILASQLEIALRRGRPGGARPPSDHDQIAMDAPPVSRRQLVAVRARPQPDDLPRRVAEQGEGAVAADRPRRTFVAAVGGAERGQDGFVAGPAGVAHRHRFAAPERIRGGDGGGEPVAALARELERSPGAARRR